MGFWNSMGLPLGGRLAQAARPSSRQVPVCALQDRGEDWVDVRQAHIVSKEVPGVG